MFPILSFQKIIQAIRERNVPLLDLVDAFADVSKWIAAQLRTEPQVFTATSVTMTEEKLCECLEQACESHESATFGAAAIDWRTVLSTLIRLLPLLFPLV